MSKHVGFASSAVSPPQPPPLRGLAPSTVNSAAGVFNLTATDLAERDASGSSGGEGRSFSSPRAPPRHVTREALARSFSSNYTFGASGQRSKDSTAQVQPTTGITTDSGDDDDLTIDHHTPTIQTCHFPGLCTENPKLPTILPFAFPFNGDIVADAVDKVKANESMSVQNTFSAAVDEMLLSRDFCTIVHGMLWYLILTLQQKYLGSSSSTKPKPKPKPTAGVPSPSADLTQQQDDELSELRNKTIFHVVSMSYGHLFSTLRTPPVSGTRIMQHKESVMQVLPLVVPRVVYYIASSVFTTVEDERKFDRALRGTLQKTFSYWVLGVVPQQMQLTNWVQFVKVRTVRRHREFSAAGMAASLDAALGPDRRPHHSPSASGRGDVDSAGGLAGSSGSGGAGTSPLATGSGKRTHNNKPSAPKTQQQRASPREVQPTLRHTGNLWYECGAVRGHLTVERMNESAAPVESVCCQASSPLMAHYLAELEVDVAQRGAERAITWTGLSSLDAQRTRLRFSRHAERISDVAQSAVVATNKAHENLLEGERRDIVHAQRTTRFWQGKAKLASEMLSAMYSPLFPSTRVLYRDLMRGMAQALDAIRSPIMEQIHALTSVLLRVHEHLFSIPMPRRHRVQLRSVLCYKRLKTLERRLPAVLEAKEPAFGETVTFSDAARAQLYELFGTLRAELGRSGVDVGAEDDGEHDALTSDQSQLYVIDTSSSDDSDDEGNAQRQSATTSSTGGGVSQNSPSATLRLLSTANALGRLRGAGGDGDEIDPAVAHFNSTMDAFMKATLGIDDAVGSHDVSDDDDVGAAGGKSTSGADVHGTGNSGLDDPAELLNTLRKETLAAQEHHQQQQRRQRHQHLQHPNEEEGRIRRHSASILDWGWATGSDFSASGATPRGLSRGNRPTTKDTERRTAEDIASRTLLQTPDHVKLPIRAGVPPSRSGGETAATARYRAAFELFSIPQSPRQLTTSTSTPYLPPVTSGSNTSRGASRHNAVHLGGVSPRPMSQRTAARATIPMDWFES